ncbi:MAG: hypothetical protein D6820_05950 [Lentisphaerae bacterium]|nr:MAG: hypothetical protein D6820_05950 [Lentisphaerota bacterium]
MKTCFVTCSSLCLLKMVHLLMIQRPCKNTDYRLTRDAFVIGHTHSPFLVKKMVEEICAKITDIPFDSKANHPFSGEFPRIPWTHLTHFPTIAEEGFSGLQEFPG